MQFPTTDSDSFGIDTPEDLAQAIAGGIEKYNL